MHDAATHRPAQPMKPPRMPRRLNLVLLFFTCNLICYMDRINIAVTAPVIMKELGWNEAALGIILSSFFWGYTLLQIPGGWLADRYGGKRVLSIGVLWWSFFTLITPLARTAGAMAIMRSLMGLGEGVNFPSIQSLASKWIPVGERSRVSGFILSGISVGNIIAFPLATWIMTTLWLALCFLYFRPVRLFLVYLLVPVRGGTARGARGHRSAGACLYHRKQAGASAGGKNSVVAAAFKAPGVGTGGQSLLRELGIFYVPDLAPHVSGQGPRLLH